jgi:L-cystine uptake protein TcyP (sodium:dicarboxylate symporter family)
VESGTNLTSALPRAAGTTVKTITWLAIFAEMDVVLIRIVIRPLWSANALKHPIDRFRHGSEILKALFVLLESEYVGWEVKY